MERLLEELKGAVEISEHEPPPSSFLSLLGTHEWLDEHFLLHQEALLAGDLALAFELLEKVEAGEREHIRVEEELLLPVYERAGHIPGGNPQFYVNEHRKMLAILDGFKETFPRLQGLLHPHLVLPVVAEVVLVEEPLAMAEVQIVEGGLMSFTGKILAVGVSVFPSVDGETPEVVALPSHRQPDDLM